jgi:hypothetical protein
MKSSLAVLCTLAVLGTCAVAQDKGFGLGILLGEPSGLSGKMWVSQVNAVDAGLAWSFKNSGFLHIHADYLWHFPDVISSSERLVLSAGLGGRLGTGHDAVLGVRIPFALAWWPHGVPLDLFLELAPGLDLLPATEFAMQGGIGIRWFF